MKRRIQASKKHEMTIEGAFDEFLYEKRALNKAPKTITSYEGSFKRWMDFLREQGKSIDLSDLNSWYVISFCVSLLEARDESYHAELLFASYSCFFLLVYG